MYVGRNEQYFPLMELKLHKYKYLEFVLNDSTWVSITFLHCAKRHSKRM